MNHSLKNPDAHRRLARGANVGVENNTKRERFVYVLIKPCGENSMPFWWQVSTFTTGKHEAEQEAIRAAIAAGYQVIQLGPTEQPE